MIFIGFWCSVLNVLLNRYNNDMQETAVVYLEMTEPLNRNSVSN